MAQNQYQAKYERSQLQDMNKSQQQQNTPQNPPQQQMMVGGPSVAFQRFFQQLPGQDEPIPFNKMQQMQSYQGYAASGNLSQQIIHGETEQPQIDKLKQFQNFTPLIEKKKKKYIRQHYEHTGVLGCSQELVCIQADCRQLPRLCCTECFAHLHVGHQTENVEQFFQRQRERLKRKDGVHKTHLHEAQQVINHNRRRRMKFWKWSVKMMKKVENECRSVEQFTSDKINTQLSCNSRREIFSRLTQLMQRNKHSKLDGLMRTNPEIFYVKEEINEPTHNRKETELEICDICDQLYIIEEKERDKSSVGRSASPSPALITQQLKTVSDAWDKMIKKVMGAQKRFSNKMLKSTRLSIQDSPHIKITEIKLISEHTEDKNNIPAVIGVWLLSEKIVATIHPNIVQVWEFNNIDFQSFRPRAFMKLDNLKHVIAAPINGELIMLHDLQTIWAMAFQGGLKLSKTFFCPIRELRLGRLAINAQETILYSSGGCRQNGSYIVCWSYQRQTILRVIYNKCQFPHEGDLLTNSLSQHIFKCNKNSVEIYHAISGESFQTITLRKTKHIIEKTTILKNFANRDCFCLSTSYGNFCVYAFEDKKYKLVYEVDSGKKCLYTLFYESQLAEEGFFLSIAEGNECKVSFQDLNKKVLLSEINFKDQINCGRSIYKRNPWHNQLSLMLGFQSGFIRVLIISK